MSRPSVHEVAARLGVGLVRESRPTTAKPGRGERGGPAVEPSDNAVPSRTGGLSPASPSSARTYVTEKVRKFERAVETFRDVLAGHVEWCERCDTAGSLGEACERGRRLLVAAKKTVDRLSLARLGVLL